MMKNILRESFLAVVVVALLGGVVLADPKGQGQKKKGEDSQKTVIIQLDASKLSPEVLAQLVKAAGGKPDDKPGLKGSIKKSGDKKPDESKPGDKKPGEGAKGKGFGLADAIVAAEKHAKGHAYKAEFGGDG